MRTGTHRVWIPGRREWAMGLRRCEENDVFFSISFEAIALLVKVMAQEPFGLVFCCCVLFIVQGETEWVM